jgi:hypothetical protein
MEPLPCPFCGAQPTENAIEPHTHSGPLKALGIPDHGGSHVIECACGAGMIADTREAVLALWNRRPLQLQGAASPQGGALDAEAGRSPPSYGARPNSPETRQLLQQAAEALEEAAEIFGDPTCEWPDERNRCASLAAALRALGER